MDEAKERLDGYLRLYEAHRDSFNRRRDIGWKLNIAFWAAVFAGTGYLSGKLEVSYWHLPIHALLWVFYVFGWTANHWRANQKDRNWATVYRSHAESMLGMKVPEERLEYQSPSFFGFFACWSRWCQILISGLVLLGSWWWLHATRP